MTAKHEVCPQCKGKDHTLAVMLDFLANDYDKLAAEHAKLVAYLQKTPKVSRIEQLRAYLTGVGK